MQKEFKIKDMWRLNQSSESKNWPRVGVGVAVEVVGKKQRNITHEIHMAGKPRNIMIAFGSHRL